MNTLKIPLTETLKAFVETETAAGGHASASDFVLALVEEAQKKRAWEKAEELVLEGMQTPARPLTDEDWQKLYERIHHAKSVIGAKT
jgi:Arc/MetJ-type ribon-helix-helix transcriptional regulator